MAAFTTRPPRRDGEIIIINNIDTEGREIIIKIITNIYTEGREIIILIIITNIYTEG